MCKYWAILFKELEHLQVLVSIGEEVLEPVSESRGNCASKNPFRAVGLKPHYMLGPPQATRLWFLLQPQMVNSVGLEWDFGVFKVPR